MVSKRTDNQEPMSYQALLDENHSLQRELNSLRTRLKEDERLRHTEEELQKIAERYRTLFMNMTEGFLLAEVICNKDGKPYDYRYLEINPAFELNTGMKREQLLGRTVLEVFPDVNHKLVEKYLEIAFTDKAKHFEVFSKKLNKHLDVYVFSPERGKIAIIFRDITERKQMEEKTRQRIEEIETVMEVAPAAIWIAHDTQSHNITGNRMANEIYGAKTGENVSANITPVRRFFQESHELAADELPMQKATLKDIDVRNEELDVLLPSGEWVAILGSASPLHDINGNVRGGVAAFMDITQRKKAEAKLKETLDNLEELVKQRTAELEKAYDSLKESERGLAQAQRIAHIGNWDWNLITDEIYVSDETYRILGHNPQELKPNYDILLNHVHPDDRDYVDDALKQALKGKPLNIDFRIVLADSVELIVSEQAEIVLDEKNNPVQMIGTVQDITELKKAEEVLRASEARFRSLYENSLDGILLTKPDGTILSANPQSCSLFGMTEDEIIKAGRDSLVFQDEKLAFALEDRNRTGRAKAELTLKRKNGSTFVGEVSSSLFVDSNGITKSSLIIRDITERKQAEEKIRYLANIVESSNDAIITKSLDGIILSWNKGAEQIYGYSAEEILGKNVTILMPFQPNNETEALSQRIKKGKKIHHYETLRLRKDGTTINVSLSLSPVFDVTGKLTAVSVIARDITKRKKAEEALRKSKEQYQTLFNSISEGFANYKAIYDEQGIICNLLLLEINPAGARILGIEREIDKTVRELLPGIKDSWFEAFNRVDQKGESVRFESFGNITGKWYVTQIDRIEKGQFAVVFRDITEKKVAEETLSKIETARKKEIHHRIKNNLQVISSLLDLQAEKFRNKNHLESTEVLEAFRESQNRIMSIAFIHKELHEGKGLEKLNFSLYLEKLAENLFQTYRVGNSGISLDLNLEDNVFFDIDVAVPLGMIVNELISNSFKYAFPGRDKGTIRIKLFSKGVTNEPNNKEELKTKDTKYTLIIADNGIGIPDNINLENTDTLGLQLVSILVDQLDGKIKVERDQGTEFTICFNTCDNGD